MTKRIVFGSVMIALLGGLFYWDNSLEGSSLAAMPLAVLAALMAIAAVYELAGMLRKAKINIMPLVGGVCAALVLTEPAWRNFSGSLKNCPDLHIYLTGGAVMVCFFAQMCFYRCDHAIKRLAGTFMAIMYIGLLGSFILRIRVDFGLLTLVGFLLTVKATDIGAYFTGTMIGKHKIIPWLSPGKSWEGLAGGIAFSLLAAWGFDRIVNMPYNGFAQTAGFAIAMTLVGQFGDLCESLLKRDSGVKDSASAIPEFGGVLDLIDSPLVAAPVAYAIFKML